MILFMNLGSDIPVKDNRIEVYDVNKQLITILSNAKETCLYFNTPKSTISDYIKSGKLYKGKYYFSNPLDKRSGKLILTRYLV